MLLIGFRSCAALFLCCLALFPAQATEPARRTFELTITGSAVPAGQRVLHALKGDVVTLRIASDTAGELHIHGYRQAAMLAVAGKMELTFAVHATGRYRIEWHATGQRGKGDQHGPALATLEVRPRE